MAGTTRTLSGPAAVKQLKEQVAHQSVCMMVTGHDRYPGNARPMSVVEVDDEGHFWFLTLMDTNKCDELAQDPRTTLYFADPGNMEYLALNGKGTVLDDDAKKQELWRPIAKAWVPDGVDDPDLRVLKVTLDDGYYWDTKDGKVVSGIKIITSMITGRPSDGGVEGNITV